MNEWKNFRTDEVFRVGDIITTYHKGVHRLIRIEGRDSRTPAPLFHYERILDSKFQPKKGSNRCDASYCQHFTVDHIKDKLAEITATYNAAIKYFHEKNLHQATT